MAPAAWSSSRVSFVLRFVPGFKDGVCGFQACSCFVLSFELLSCHFHLRCFLCFLFHTSVLIPPPPPTPPLGPWEPGRVEPGLSASSRCSINQTDPASVASSQLGQFCLCVGGEMDPRPPPPAQLAVASVPSVCWWGRGWWRGGGGLCCGPSDCAWGVKLSY